MHESRRKMIRKLRNETIGNVQFLNKAVVWGILDREQRKVRATVVPAVNLKVLQEEILRHIAHGSKIYTDEASLYNSIPKEYVHDFVNHLQQYVKGSVHTNGLENFWSLLKRSLKGSYVAVEPFHLFRYIDEQTFRYNYRLGASGRRLKDGERFDLALSQIAGKRLTFAEVTGKVGQAAN